MEMIPPELYAICKVRTVSEQNNIAASRLRNQKSVRHWFKCNAAMLQAVREVERGIEVERTVTVNQLIYVTDS